MILSFTNSLITLTFTYQHDILIGTHFTGNFNMQRLLVGLACSFLLVQIVVADDDRYLCTEENSIGFFYHSESDHWQASETPQNEKYLITKEREFNK